MKTYNDLKADCLNGDRQHTFHYAVLTQMMPASDFRCGKSPYQCASPPTESIMHVMVRSI